MRLVLQFRLKDAFSLGKRILTGSKTLARCRRDEVAVVHASAFAFHCMFSQAPNFASVGLEGLVGSVGEGRDGDLRLDPGQRH